MTFSQGGSLQQELTFKRARTRASLNLEMSFLLLRLGLGLFKSILLYLSLSHIQGNQTQGMGSTTELHRELHLTGSKSTGGSSTPGISGVNRVLTGEMLLHAGHFRSHSLD